MSRLTLPILPALLAVAAFACTAEVTLVPANQESESDSTPGDTTGNDTTVVQRATFTVTAQVAAPDAGIATQLGWTGGVIAGATVRAPRGSQDLVGTTDSLGRVTFTEVVPGLRQVSVLRVLTDAERALLNPQDAGLSAFGGGGNVNVGPPVTEVAFATRATRRGSLVISENFQATWLGNQSYLLGTYIELYNNSDTTVFLDGKLLGFGPSFLREAPEFGRPCSLTQQWQGDPDGLWTPLLYRLPGSGQQYPLAPGEAAVLATDAVDHSIVDPRWPDLSSARFEFLGPADSDNPAAANITPVATAFDDVLGHGPRFDGGEIYFVADPVDLATLPTVQPPNYRSPIPRIPREKILDVATLLVVRSFYDQYGFMLCDVLVNPIFDSGPAFIADPAIFMSVARPAFGRLLLRSRSSLNDFVVLTVPTPGSVP
jgi:hypothetical protein